MFTIDKCSFKDLLLYFAYLLRAKMELNTYIYYSKTYKKNIYKYDIQ